MENKKIVVVTGANTGLGFSLVRKMCELFRDKAIVFLTARDENKGMEATENLKKLGFNPQFHLLDVNSEISISKFSKYISDLYGGIDIIFHNAAARISPKLSQQEQVENFINTNNYGTTRIIKAFQPLLNDNSKFIIVASSFGSLNNINSSLHHKFDILSMDLEDIDNVMNEYMIHVKRGTSVENGWPEWMNIPSKIGQVASMKVLARLMREQKAKERNISIYAVCPGLMDTEASRPWFKDMSMAKQPDEAAEDLLWLVSQKEWREDMYGILFQYKKPISWNHKMN